MAALLKSAGEVPREALHAAMLRGFSDYVVPMQPTFTQFETIMARRSFVPELSFVSEEAGAVTAIWLVGRRGDRAYLIASATAPEARGQGLARGLAECSFEALRGAGVTAMQTEVIEGNAAAEALYGSLGFEVVRTLACFDVPAVGGGPIAAVGFEEIRAETASLCDWAPSWQNADEAVAGGPEVRCVALRDGGALIGFGVLMPESHSVAQIAVAPAARRRGVGRRLMGALQEMAGGQALRLLNADAADAGFAAFMAALGARARVRQLELLRPL